MAYTRLGIIPAAGKAERFGGIFKELMPTMNGISLLEESANRLHDCNEIVVVTNKEKIEDHARCIGSRAYYEIVKHFANGDMWEGIYAGIKHTADYYLFTMPDTLMPADSFKGCTYSDFEMGMHFTCIPERYGVLRDGRIVNKEPGDAGMAWGVMGWSRAVAEYWLTQSIDTYTDAINMAISHFGIKTWQLEYYYDNASMFDYVEYIRRGVK